MPEQSRAEHVEHHSSTVGDRVATRYRQKEVMNQLGLQTQFRIVKILL